mgnify:CR=1 FL=1
MAENIHETLQHLNILIILKNICTSKKDLQKKYFSHSYAFSLFLRIDHISALFGMHTFMKLFLNSHILILSTHHILNRPFPSSAYSY